VSDRLCDVDVEFVVAFWVAAEVVARVETVCWACVCALVGV
jgi:hypothetical protein